MKLYWQPRRQKSTVFTAFRSNSRHTENKVNGKDGARSDDASSQPCISVQQIKLPFVFYEGAMTSWQGNPRVLPEKAAITGSTHPNQIGCFRERSSLAGVQFVILYILNVQPASAHIVFVPTLGTKRLSVSIMAYSLCHDVAEDDAERLIHRKLVGSIDTGNEKTGLVLFQKYILFSCCLN